MVAAALLAVVPSVAWAAEPLALQPTTDWVLDYGSERCTLQRTFTAGNTDLIMQIISHGSPYSTRIVLAGGAIAPTNKPWDLIAVRLTPDAQPRRDILALNGKTGEDTAVSFSLDLGPDYDRVQYSKLSPAEQEQRATARLSLRPDFERTTTSFTVELGRKQALDIRTGRMSGPLEALRTCVADLRVSWGLDPAVEQTLSRRVLIRQGTVQEIQNSFPTEMNIAGLNAYVPVRVAVDEQGKAGACVVQIDLPEAFKVAVCNSLEKSFDPALDASGQPVRSIYNVSVIYTLR